MVEERWVLGAVPQQVLGQRRAPKRRLCQQHARQPPVPPTTLCAATAAAASTSAAASSTSAATAARARRRLALPSGGVGLEAEPLAALEAHEVKRARVIALGKQVGVAPGRELAPQLVRPAWLMRRGEARVRGAPQAWHGPRAEASGFERGTQRVAGWNMTQAVDVPVDVKCHPASRTIGGRATSARVSRNSTELIGGRSARSRLRSHATE